jgi:hypothetical protein
MYYTQTAADRQAPGGVLLVTFAESRIPRIGFSRRDLNLPQDTGCISADTLVHAS